MPDASAEILILLPSYGADRTRRRCKLYKLTVPRLAPMMSKPSVAGFGERLNGVFWAGVLFLILSVFNVRTHIVKAIPKPLRFAISAGIGLFISLIGFENAKFIVSNPATLISVANVNNPIILTFLFGLFLTSILIDVPDDCTTVWLECCRTAPHAFPPCDLVRVTKRPYRHTGIRVDQ